MSETQVVSALVDKRAEIAGQITRFEQQIGQFRADLTHVDETIRLFAPDLDISTMVVSAFAPVGNSGARPQLGMMSVGLEAEAGR